MKSFKLFTSCCKEKNNTSYYGSIVDPTECMYYETFEEPKQYINILDVNTDRDSIYGNKEEASSKFDNEYIGRTYIHTSHTKKFRNEIKTLEDVDNTDTLENLSVIHTASSVVHNISVVHLKKSNGYTPVGIKRHDILGDIEIDDIISSEPSLEPELII